MAASARAELEARGQKQMAVLGGGRIAFDEAARVLKVYGYSKTYGRCSQCNRLAAELIRGDPEHHGLSVSWSNEGY